MRKNNPVRALVRPFSSTSLGGSVMKFGREVVLAGLMSAIALPSAWAVPAPAPVVRAPAPVVCAARAPVVRAPVTTAAKPATTSVAAKPATPVKPVTTTPVKTGHRNSRQACDAGQARCHGGGETRDNNRDRDKTRDDDGNHDDAPGAITQPHPKRTSRRWCGAGGHGAKAERGRRAGQRVQTEGDGQTIGRAAVAGSAEFPEARDQRSSAD